MRRIDPRADPTSLPPERVTDHSVDRVIVPGGIARPTAHRDDEATPAIAPVEKRALLAQVEGIEPGADQADGARESLSLDPRFALLEQRLDANDWAAVIKALGPLADARQAPPAIGLLVALAHNEATLEGNSDSAEVALLAVAKLLSVPKESPIARVIARRILRKNPIRLRDRQAPPGRIIAVILTVTVLVGALIGWLVSGGWYLARAWLGFH